MHGAVAARRCCWWLPARARQLRSPCRRVTQPARPANSLCCRSYWRLLPKVEALAGALTEYCGPDGKPSGKSIFTQFITADEPGQGNGSWGLYYQNRPKGELAAGAGWG